MNTYCSGAEFWTTRATRQPERQTETDSLITISKRKTELEGTAQPTHEHLFCQLTHNDRSFIIAEAMELVIIIIMYQLAFCQLA